MNERLGLELKFIRQTAGSLYAKNRSYPRGVSRRMSETLTIPMGFSGACVLLKPTGFELPQASLLL
jgi:hypothetical protein